MKKLFYLLFILFFHLNGTTHEQIPKSKSWNEVAQEAESYQYYSPQNLERINKINEDILKSKASIDADEAKIKPGFWNYFSPTSNLRKEEIEEALANIQKRRNTKLRQKHAPLYIISAPDGNDDSGALKTTLYDFSIAPFNPILLLNVSLWRMLLEDQRIEFNRNDYLSFVKTKYSLYHVENTIFFICIPHWFKKYYVIKNCFKNLIESSDLFDDSDKMITFCKKIESHIESTDKRFVADLQKVFTLNNEKAPCWDVNVEGHGGKDHSVAGLQLDYFINFLYFFSTKVKTGTMILNSCFIGGSNADFINKKLKEKSINYHLILASIGEVTSYISKLNKQFDFTDFTQNIRDSQLLYFIKDYFNDTAQLEEIEKYYNQKRDSLSPEGELAQKAFENLLNALTTKIANAQGSLHKSEYLPYFKLKGSKQFKTLKDVPGFFVIDPKNENLDRLIPPKDTHSIIFQTSNIHNLELQSTKTPWEEVENSVSKNLNFLYNNKIPEYSFPTFLFLTNNGKDSTFDTIDLKDKKNKIGIHAFFTQFFNTNIISFPFIFIKELTGFNEITHCDDEIKQIFHQATDQDKKITLKEIILIKKFNRLYAYFTINKIEYSLYMLLDDPIIITYSKFKYDILPFFDHEILRKVFKYKPQYLHATDEYGYNLLHNACALDEIDVVQFLLTQHFNFNAKTKHAGKTTLMIAAESSSPEILKMLLAQKELIIELTINDTDYNNNTALYYACKSKNAAKIKMLLECKSINRIGRKNTDGQAPRDLVQGDQTLENLFDEYDRKLKEKKD